MELPAWIGDVGPACHPMKGMYLPPRPQALLTHVLLVHPWGDCCHFLFCTTCQPHVHVRSQYHVLCTYAAAAWDHFPSLTVANSVAAVCIQSTVLEDCLGRPGSLPQPGAATAHMALDHVDFPSVTVAATTRFVSCTGLRRMWFVPVPPKPK